MKKSFYAKIIFIGIVFVMTTLFCRYAFVEAEEDQAQDATENQEVEINISQDMEKYLQVSENQVMLQQKIDVTYNNINSEDKKTETMNISVPEIENIKPDIAIVLLSGQKLDSNLYEYNEDQGIINIELSKDDNINGWEDNNKQYKIIYGYMDSEMKEDIPVTSNINVNLQKNDDSIYNAESNLEKTINQIGSKISNNLNITQNINKGYLYTNEDRTINFVERYNIEISNLQDVENINIVNNGSNFTYQIEEEEKSYNSADNYIYIAKTIINKDNVMKILGEDGELQIINNNNEVIHTINKDTETDEEGNIELSYDNQLAKDIRFLTTSPKELGTLVITNGKYIKANLEYTAEEIRDFTTLEQNISVNDIQEISEIVLDEPKTVIDFNVNKEQLDTMAENGELELNITLKSNDSSEKLFDNPYIEVTLPSQVQEITLAENPSILYDEELSIGDVTVENNIVKIQLNGTQTKYKDEMIEGTVLNLKLNLKLDNKAVDSEEKIDIKCINQEEETHAEKNINITSPTDIITVTSIEELNLEIVGKKENQKIEILPTDANNTYTIKSKIINSKKDIQNVTILGDLPTDNNNIQNGQNTLTNNMRMILQSNVETNNENATVYYTENPNATSDIQDGENGWTTDNVENPVKYLIKVDEMKKAETLEIQYQVQTASNLDFNMMAYQGYNVEYTDVDNNQNSMSSTYVQLTTGDGPTVDTNIYAVVANENLQPNEEVKRGQVIKYVLEVTNTGTEDIENALLYGEIPEGTVYVEPIEDYPYLNGEYYREVEKDRQEFTIESLKIGETIQETYEVRVKNDATIDSTISNLTTIEYNGVTRQSEALTNKVIDAKLRVTVKSNLDTSITDIYEGNSIQYQAIIENISDEIQENVQLKWNISEGYTIASQVVLNTETFENTDITSDMDTITLGEIAPNQKVLVNINLIAEAVNQEVSIYAQTIQENEICTSNILGETIISTSNVDVLLEANNEGGYVTPGDEITYKITLTNNNAIDTSVNLYDSIPTELTLQEITLNGEQQELGEEYNVVQISGITLDTEDNKTAVIELKTVVNYVENTNEIVKISNQARVDILLKEIYSNEVVHMIEYNSVDPGEEPEPTPEPTPDPDDPSNPSDPGNPNDPNNPSQTYSYNISGRAWIDSNKSGGIENGEENISDVNVYLVDVTTGQVAKNSSGNDITATTDNDGYYILTGISQGRYMVAFEYDTSNYKVTSYMVSGIDSSRNSKVVSRSLSLNGQDRTYAVTDIISVTNQNISNINMGLVKSELFDLKLDKYINRVIVSGSNNTRQYDYADTSLAKIELRSNALSNTNITIRYKIQVTNVGELSGYVRNVIDYIPEGLVFDERLNTGWVQNDNQIYNTSLANEEIQPGESKEITLLLVKESSSTGLGNYINTAEIGEVYNEDNITDINSTPGNNQDGENDMSSAELIISISTGTVVMYVGLILVLVSVIIVGIYFIKKEVL